jgi:pimeloyl-ACP methyl ester carboxylesterase
MASDHDAVDSSTDASQTGFSEPTRRWLAAGAHHDIDGHLVFAHDSGRGSAIVFIHGFPTSAFDWSEVINELNSTHRCVAIDLRGFGLSDKPQAWSYSLFQQADLVESVLSELRIDSAHIVSHDMGTSVHCELLAREIEGRLSFEPTHSTFLNGSMIKTLAKLTTFQQILEPPSRVPEAMEMVAAMMPVYVDSLKGLMGRPEAVTDEIATVMHEVMAYQDGNLRIPAVYCYVRERYLHMDRWLGALADTTVPLQLVWGTDDPVAVIEMGRELHRQLPHADYRELEGVGHFVPTEAPVEVADAIRSIRSR